MERQFQQRQSEPEQPQQQQLCPCSSLLKMIVSMFSYENLYQAYLDCRKNKRNKPDALLFEMNAEENILRLHHDLIERTYRPSTSTCFVTRKPKLREIFAADFGDRITHHLVVRYLEKIWEPLFIYDSFASRPRKGIHLAAQRLQKFTREVTHNGTLSAFYLQMDIRNFFMTINKNILYALLQSRCRNKEILWLVHTLIFHDPTEDYQLKSSKNLLRRIPHQKSLFGTESDQGLPIGNLTSQFFANVYLNALDQFVKHTLKCRFYMRYVDDFVLLHPSKEQLGKWHQQIECYLNSRLKLALNPSRKRLLPVYNGIDFVGYIIRPRYVLARNRVVNNLKTKLRDFEQKLIRIQDGVKSIKYDSEPLNELFDSLNSYLAHFKHADTFKLTRHVFEAYSYLRYYFVYKPGKLKRVYTTPGNFGNMRSQYRYFQSKYYDTCMFFQVGCFYEFYGKQAVRAEKCLGLSMIKGKYGFRHRCGIGIRALNRYITIALKKNGWPVVVINQTGYILPHVAERRIAVKYVPIRHRQRK